MLLGSEPVTGSPSDMGLQLFGGAATRYGDVNPLCKLSECFKTTDKSSCGEKKKKGRKCLAGESPRPDLHPLSNRSLHYWLAITSVTGSQPDVKSVFCHKEPD